MRKLLLIANMVVLLMSCDRADKKETPPLPPKETSYSEEDVRLQQDRDEVPVSDKRNQYVDEDRDVYNRDVDNTGRNVRDRNPNAITPGDQSESEADRTITQNIRKAIIDDGSLSINAKNVKIITINGIVTLRGVVNTAREKAAIAKKAESIAGVKSVKNLLEEKQ